MSVRITKQRQDRKSKYPNNGEVYPNPPVLIESTLLLVPEQTQPMAFAFESPTRNLNVNNSLMVNGLDSSRTFSAAEQISPIPSIVASNSRSNFHRAPIPVHDASQWFIGPNLHHERSDRMEKVVSSLVRRSTRATPTYGFVSLYYFFKEENDFGNEKFSLILNQFVFMKNNIR